MKRRNSRPNRTFIIFAIVMIMTLLMGLGIIFAFFLTAPDESTLLLTLSYESGTFLPQNYNTTFVADTTRTADAIMTKQATLDATPDQQE